MTALQFARECASYYGAWKVEAHAAAAASYVQSKSGAFLSALWEVLKERRDPKEGPPSIAVLLGLAGDAAGRMMKYQPPPLMPPPGERIRDPGLGSKPITAEEIAKWSPIEDGPGDRWLSQREAHEALELVLRKLKEKKV